MTVKKRLGKVYIYLTLVRFLVYYECMFGILNIAIGFQSCDIPRALLYEMRGSGTISAEIMTEAD